MKDRIKNNLKQKINKTSIISTVVLLIVGIGSILASAEVVKPDQTTYPDRVETEALVEPNSDHAKFVWNAPRVQGRFVYQYKFNDNGGEVPSNGTFGPNETCGILASSDRKIQATEGGQSFVTNQNAKYDTEGAAGALKIENTQQLGNYGHNNFYGLRQSVAQLKRITGDVANGQKLDMSIYYKTQSADAKMTIGVLGGWEKKLRYTGWILANDVKKDDTYAYIIKPLNITGYSGYLDYFNDSDIQLAKTTDWYDISQKDDYNVDEDAQGLRVNENLYVHDDKFEILSTSQEITAAKNYIWARNSDVGLSSLPKTIVKITFDANHLPGKFTSHATKLATRKWVNPSVGDNISDAFTNCDISSDGCNNGGWSRFQSIINVSDSNMANFPLKDGGIYTNIYNMTGTHDGINKDVVYNDLYELYIKYCWKIDRQTRHTNPGLPKEEAIKEIENQYWSTTSFTNKYEKSYSDSYDDKDATDIDAPVINNGTYDKTENEIIIDAADYGTKYYYDLYLYDAGNMNYPPTKYENYLSYLTNETNPIISGIKGYKYSIDGGEFQDIGSGTDYDWDYYLGYIKNQATFIISRDKIGYTAHTINIYAYDGKKNKSNIKSVTIPAEDTPPTLTLTQDPTEWTNGSVTISASSNDTESGVLNITKPDKTVVTGSSTTYAVSSNGTYTFKSKDNAGNEVTQSITISNIDKTAPILTLTRDNASWTNGNITITASVTDGDSGVYGVAQLGEQYYNTVSVKTYTITGNGTYTFFAMDNAGNVISKNITISNIDKTAPSGTFDPDGCSWRNKGIDVKVTSTDTGGSGINKCNWYYTNDNGNTWIYGATGTSVINWWDGWNASTKTKVDIFDNAGNSTTIYSNDFNIDSINPTTGTANNPEARYSNARSGTMRVQVNNVNDNLSGVAGVDYWIGIDNGAGGVSSWLYEKQAGTQSGTNWYWDFPLYLTEGKYRIRAHAYDKAGNGEGTLRGLKDNGWSNAIDQIIVIDRTGPIKGSIEIQKKD